MPYYELNWEIPEDENGGYAEISDKPVDGISTWISGEKFDVEFDLPLHFEIEPEDGYKGPLPEIYFANTFLMSDRLVKKLKEFGVDNIDCYSTILTNTETGQNYDYQAVNVIGAVSAANLDESEWENYDGEAEIDTFFDKLVIDEEKTKGLVLFRLAESLTKIIINERLKKHLEKFGLDTLVFIPLS